MKDTPLLMKEPLVCATQEDRKTQTRRLNGLDAINFDAGRPSAHMWKYKGVADAPLHLFEFADGINGEVVKCPYGKPGDRLWVKETHYRYGVWCKNGFTRAGKRRWKFKFYTQEVRYFNNPPDKILTVKGDKVGWYKRPSIFMPRWASRINLEITAIRVERVQDITREDVLAEGLRPLGYGRATEPQYCIKPFGDLWDSINAARGYPWKDNPWVWVVEFKRVTA